MKIFATAATLLAAAITTVTAAPHTTSACTYTAKPCEPFNGPVKTITVYEVPFITQTATETYDCHGCNAVTVSSKVCDFPGIPIQTTTFVVAIEPTTTVAVCSPTPN